MMYQHVLSDLELWTVPISFTPETARKPGVDVEKSRRSHSRFWDMNKAHHITRDLSDCVNGIDHLAMIDL